MQVEIVYAGPDAQIIAAVELGDGATVAAAIAAAVLLPQFVALELIGLPVGIFGKLATPETRLRDGDRVEFYRPLQADAKQSRARRARIKAGKSAGG